MITPTTDILNRIHNLRDVGETLLAINHELQRDNIFIPFNKLMQIFNDKRR